eukprot:CAMPEP_0119044580 /NCGR_PEP_ID=MMETSP1177-20130426/32699_1 /TAXON_ID=2985 /ORGANISM="Ochromonas sp, Strain CCMP1899" /LENGTH=192 /DNA_ID=CAMNT_0007014901 /DNA_START=311 /DNA_END=892 /DNA_ORIENTATION=-
MSTSFKILLLTHAKELSRKTNTGKLVTDTSFAKLISWDGRGDNIKVSEAIDNLSQPVLIWIDGPRIIKEDLCAANSDPTYVILDGTWQEAKNMFKKGPDCLRTIPRLSLEPTFKSTYKLRGNYGYVEKFAESNDTDGGDDVKALDSNLLCTVEVCASLLLKHGHKHKAEVLLGQLEEFQMSFQKYFSILGRT